jgi:membrane protein required for colicin V production
MQPYDVLMLVVLAGAVLFGVWKGMAWQVASLASVVVSAAVAVHSSPVIASYFRGKEPWNRFCAMAVLYVITAGAIWILFRLVSNIIDRVKLKEFDRQLGATFGLAKGVLYCIVITFFAVTLSESSRQVVLASHSGDLIARGIRNANPVLPEDVRKYLGEYIDELDKGLHAPPQNSAPQTDGLNPNPQPPPQEAPKQSPKAPEQAPKAPGPAEGRGAPGKLEKLLLGK